jgi:hypothetical protein
MYLSLDFLGRIYRAGFLAILVLVVVDLLVFFYYPEPTLRDIFLATREQTPLTWISSLAMVLIAFSCLGAYLKNKEKLWFFLAVIFAFFSMDDATYLHERLSGFFRSKVELFSGFPSYIWVVLYLPLLLFSLGALIYLLWRDAGNFKNKKIVGVALMMIGVAVGLDFVDGLVERDSSLVFCLEDRCHEIVTHFFRLSEEVLEAGALGILGYTNIKEHNLLAEDQKKSKKEKGS